MKLLHLADVHVGCGTHGKYGRVNSRVERSIRLLSEALSEEKDRTLIAGDLFHSTNPTPTWRRMVVDTLSGRGPIDILTGNHDLPVTDRAHAVDTLRELPNVRVLDESGFYPFEDMKLLALPYPTEDDWEEKYQELLAEADENTVIAAHFTIEGSVPGGIESLSMSGEPMLSPNLFDAAYVAMGHIHAHGVFGQCVYPGSLDRYSFGEENSSLGYCLVDLPSGEWKHVESDALPYVTIEEEVESAEELQSVIDETDTAGAVVRVKYKCPEEIRPAELDIDAYKVASVSRFGVDRKTRGGIDLDVSLESALEQFASERPEHEEILPEMKAMADELT